jgi:hypothetical protein
MSLHIEHNLEMHADYELSVLFSRERAREQALLDGDFETLSSLLDHNAVHVHASGLVDNKETYMQPLRKGDVVYRSMDVTVDRVHYLTSAVVQLSGRANMDTTPSSRSEPSNSQFIMTWVHAPDGWKLSSWQSTPVVAS